MGQKEQEITAIKEKLTEEKKLVAQLNAKIEEGKAIQTKNESN